MPIIEGKHVFHTTLAERAAQIRRSVRERFGVELPEPEEEPAFQERFFIHAEINHGRWLVECPECHAHRGIWKYNYRTDFPTLECPKCTNQLF